MSDVYLTCRRSMAGSYYSVFIQKFLESKGISCYTASGYKRKGRFPFELEQKIENSRNFIVILTPETWLRSDDEKNWITCEIATAIKLNKNIIPIVTKDYVWPDIIPNSIKKIRNFDSVVLDENQLLKSVSKIVNALETSSYKLSVEPHRGSGNYIFVSYSHKDVSAVMPVIERMLEDGYRVWYDGGIDAGGQWDKVVAEHVVGCDYFIAFISNNYLNSSNCMDEIEYARNLEKKEFLVYTEKVQLPCELQMRLGRIQNIHKYEYSDEQLFYNKLFHADGLDEFK